MEPKENYPQIKKAILYDVQDAKETDTYKGIILKHNRAENGSHNHCFLVNEQEKSLLHLKEKPQGCIINTPCLTLCFNYTKSSAKIINQTNHFTIYWFDEEKTYNEIVNYLAI